MVETVFVSQAETKERALSSITGLISKGRYEEAARVIGIHSLLIDPQHTIADQALLYRAALEMVKEKIRLSKGQDYAAWLTSFPEIMRSLTTSKHVVTDAAAVDIIASHMAAYGPFRSVDDFFLWALDDRRLTLGQIVKYIEKTAELFRR